MKRVSGINSIEQWKKTVQLLREGEGSPSFLMSAMTEHLSVGYFAC